VSAALQRIKVDHEEYGYYHLKDYNTDHIAFNGLADSIRTFTIYVVLNVRAPGYVTAQHDTKYLHHIQNRSYAQKVWQRTTRLEVDNGTPAADDGHQCLRY